MQKLAQPTPAEPLRRAIATTVCHGCAGRNPCRLRDGRYTETCFRLRPALTYPGVRYGFSLRRLSPAGLRAGRGIVAPGAMKRPFNDGCTVAAGLADRRLVGPRTGAPCAAPDMQSSRVRGW